MDTTEGVRKELMATLDVNVVGLIDCTREAFKIMKKDDFGYIININRYWDISNKMSFVYKFFFLAHLATKFRSRKVLLNITAHTQLQNMLSLL